MVKPSHPDYDPETVYFEPASIRVRIPAEIIDWFKARDEDPKAGIIAVLRAHMDAQDKGAK